MLEAGDARARGETFVLANLAAGLEPRAMAARFPNGSGNKNPPDDRAAGRECGPTARDRFARALAAIAGRDRNAARFRRENARPKNRSRFRPPASRTSAIDSAHSR